MVVALGNQSLSNIDNSSYDLDALSGLLEKSVKDEYEKQFTALKNSIVTSEKNDNLDALKDEIREDQEISQNIVVGNKLDQLEQHNNARIKLLTLERIRELKQIEFIRSELASIQTPTKYKQAEYLFNNYPKQYAVLVEAGKVRSIQNVGVIAQEIYTQIQSIKKIPRVGKYLIKPINTIFKNAEIQDLSTSIA